MPARLITPSPRDLAALRFIGEGFEIAQYQLHATVFARRVDTVVSRFVRRAADRKWIVVERLHRTGPNLLRLTEAGRALLVGLGAAHIDEVFVPKRSVALKDLRHTLLINDLRAALHMLSDRPDLVLPAWALQRRLSPSAAVFPDVLAIWKPNCSSAGSLFAGEVDLGGEALSTVFVPKLGKLRTQLADWAGEDTSAATVLILTSSHLRAERISKAIGGRNETVIVPIPEDEADARIRAMRSLIEVVLSQNSTQKPP